jgi:hypothetical protein
MRRRLAVRFLILCLVLGAVGCVQQPVQPQLPEPIEPTEPLPAPTEAERPSPVDTAEPEPPHAPALIEAPEVVAQPLTDRIAIVLSDRTPAFENVATELGRLLDDYLLYDLADKSLAPSEVFAGVAELQAKVVVAIGLAATREAILRSSVPVVFCQVFNISAAQDTSVPVRGVASTPPLSGQVAAWKRLNPQLRTVGTILGPGHEALIDEAKRATAEHDVAFDHRLVSSDRETLFTFQRMAPELDGFLLFPDNRVLSVEILQEILDYAARHHVEVAVFNHALLEMGATLSATTVEADIAATALSVTSRILLGEVDGVPWMTPLSKVRVVTREGMPAARHGAAGGNP